MANQKKVAPKLDAKLTDALAKLDTTSAKVRLLDANNIAKADIARILEIRYQHVRNVLLTPLKKK